MTDLERLTLLARRARKAFELVAVRQNRPSSLGGWCQDATVFIFGRARAMGIAVDMGHVPGHYFVLLGDTVIDVTATQFGVKDKVAVLPLEDTRRRGEWWDLEMRHSDPPPPWSNRLLKMADEIVVEIASKEATP